MNTLSPPPPPSSNISITWFHLEQSWKRWVSKPGVKKSRKGKLDLYSAPLWEARHWSAQAWITHFLCCNYTTPALLPLFSLQTQTHLFWFCVCDVRVCQNDKTKTAETKITKLGTSWHITSLQPQLKGQKVKRQGHRSLNAKRHWVVGMSYWVSRFYCIFRLFMLCRFWTSKDRSSKYY